MDNGYGTIGIPPAMGGEAAQAAARGKARRKAAKVLGVLALAGVAFFARESRAGESREPGETKTVALPGGTTMEMVWCPPGEFTMGSPASEEGRYPRHHDYERQHQVTLTKGFWMAKTEVTQKQWQSVMGTTIRQQRDKEVDSSWSLYGEGDDYPMYCVSWDEAQEFCRKAGLQLPTEAQWEYACRAGSTGPYAGTGQLDDMGWYLSNSGGGAHPVGTKRANAWGLHDMHGNVWEWCADWFGNYPTGAVADPTGLVSGGCPVLRGGCWSDDAQSCRSACRSWGGPDNHSWQNGFRPVSGEP